MVREARVAASITSVDRQPVAQRRDVEGVLGLAFTSPFEQLVLVDNFAPVLADLLALVDRYSTSKTKAHRARVVNFDGRVGPPLYDGVRAGQAAAFPRFFGLLRPSRSPLGRLSTDILLRHAPPQASSDARFYVERTVVMHSHDRAAAALPVVAW